ncbi:MAG: diguanylate cyclase [Thermoleophilaceae bacterium]|nr:diguanylate cyclase [Thermoleophilaceae bacterium]
MPDLSRYVAPASERPLDVVLDAAARLMAVVKVDGGLAHWEGAWSPREASWFDAIPEGEHFAAREALSRAASSGLPVEVELSVRTSDGELRPVSWTQTAVASAEGGVTHVIATGIDRAERDRVEERLRDLVDRDHLTGLLTRRRFEEELEQHVAHGRRYGMVGALIVLDLNDFKSINERHGHRAGDRVLIGVAEALANRLRETDLLARIGGDQFGVLLPRAKPPEAERVSQALEDAIPAEVRAPGDGRIEASVGFAPFTDTMSSVEEALLAADAAMYAVKAGHPRHVRRLRPLD